MPLSALRCGCDLRRVSESRATMYRQMGMTYWLENAEAEMKEVG
jgi:hypothetical protein